MKTGKIVLAGLAVTVFGAIFGMVTCASLFNWIYKVAPTNVWRPMSGPPGAKFFIASLILNIILAYVYALLEKGIPGKGVLAKGAVFGSCIWLAGMLPGMLATAAFMTVARVVVIYWIISGLVKLIAEGVIISSIYGK